MANGVRHMVFFSARDKADIERIIAGLSLLGEIPHARHFEVKRNARLDALSENPVDVVVYAEFDDQAALTAYKAHPTYARAIEIVKPLRDLRMVADIEI